MICRVAQLVAAWQPGCEKMEREWENEEELEREWGNGKRFTLYISSPSFHFQIKDCLILSENVKYGTFVANVTKNLTYVLWENNSGSNLRRESSASCEGLGYFVTNLWLGRAPRQKKNKFMHFLVPLYRPVRYAHGILCDSEILFSRSDNCSSSLRVHDPRWLIESIQNRIIIPFFHSL